MKSNILNLEGGELHFNLEPIGDVRFHTGDEKFKLNIQPDITALESARLSVLFMWAARVVGIVGWDYKSYIEEHKLTRHFVQDKP